MFVHAPYQAARPPAVRQVDGAAAAPAAAAGEAQPPTSSDDYSLSVRDAFYLRSLLAFWHISVSQVWPLPSLLLLFCFL